MLSDYTDLEHFLRDCTVPFCCVIENSRTYSEFKQRLENVENFYLYSRKLNQIGVEQALELCTEGVKEAGNNGFQTKIDKSVLEDCYSLYSKKFASLENLQVSDILDDIDNTVEQLPLQKWSSDFKRNILPILLADLAAVWSLNESKDVADIKKRIEPHCVQILCLFRLLGVDQDASGVPKHFAQVLTGQGKSLILALLSSVIALTGNKAFVVCYSDYLAMRDETSFNLFFKTFNRFDLKNKISYNTFRYMANEILTHKVGGIKRDLRSVVSDLILNKLTKQVIDAVEVPKNTVLLIDEADVFFSDKYGETYEPVTRVGIPELLKIQPEIWSIIENGVSEKNTILRKIKEYINDIIKDEECDEFRNFLKTTADFFEKNLIKMVEDAIVVSKTKEDDTYKIDEITGFLTVKSRSFVYTSRTINGYQNTFHYFKLKKENYKHSFFSNYGYLLISLGSISYASLPVRYENILGVSGTLMTLNNCERNAIKNYGIQTMSAMPSFFGESKLVFKPHKNVLIFDTEENWLENIFESLSKSIHADRARAALIFFETDGKMKLFEQKYRNRINRLYTLTGNEKPDILEWRINESGVAQTVTLTTRTMGRGVDYKSNDRNVEENGGVHVIQTFFSLDEKEETQIKGRTARKDNKGSYELILCREDLKAIKCSENESGRSINTYAELCKIRQEIANNKGTEVEKNIRRCEQTHNMTIEFFESLADYSTEKRHQYFSKFPLVED
ncbi:protein translocase subunit SecA-like [Parasteatoda tepidariorum]|uniref:protein translocase subunit SecA-like n=1 Tax=Parasteatoda tepidariorum TaxID=114398 RepID=UPI0039BD6956